MCHGGSHWEDYKGLDIGKLSQGGSVTRQMIYVVASVRWLNGDGIFYSSAARYAWNSLWASDFPGVIFWRYCRRISCTKNKILRWNYIELHSHKIVCTWHTAGRDQGNVHKLIALPNISPLPFLNGLIKVRTSVNVGTFL